MTDAADQSGAATGGDEALAVYGTLQPGEPNHWVLRSIPGTWLAGTVRGWRYEITWGPASGYPGLTLDNAGVDIDVAILVSQALPRHWHEVDEFEGDGYQRVQAQVIYDDGQVGKAWIYETLQHAPD